MSESESARVVITRLPTDVPGLDEVLGGGLPEYSFTVIAGAPGTGKTTLAHQILFSLAAPVRRALYFSVAGEPALKMLRYQQQMAYFDPAKVGASIDFINLSDVLPTQDLDQVLNEVVRRVEEISPSLVVLDSFQNIAHVAAGWKPGGLDMQSFVQRLALHLTSWQATTFLLGNYRDSELHDNPVFTVADGVLWLSQVADHNSVVRKLQVVKMRGQELMPGLHTVRLDQAGLQVFPRITSGGVRSARSGAAGRAVTGVPGLDALVGGGLPAGDAVLISGPSGTGKSLLTAQFIAAGVRQGEPGVIAVFEEHPQEYMQRAQRMGFDLEAMVRQGSVAVIYIRPLDLSPDETLLAVREAVGRIGARRVAIDSISGFELALAPDFRQDFRESLYRLVGALTGTGITVLMTMEIVQTTSELRFSPYIISFLSDDIILLRHIEIAGRLRTCLAVIKMRNSDHNKELWLYDITGHGVIMRQSLRDAQGIGTATAALEGGIDGRPYSGLTERETQVLRALLDLGEAPVEELGRRSGVREAELTAALDRLISLRYADRRTEDGAVYRPVARSL
jgi:circadian clock protein KaiC